MKRLNPFVLSLAILTLSSGTSHAGKWVSYKNPQLGFGVKVPSSWLLKVTGRAAAFASPGEGDSRAAIGILQSRVHGFTIDQAAAKEFKQRHKPSDWKQTDATLAGARAIKIVTTKDDKKVLEYYVEGPNGYYLLQCIASAHMWSRFNDTFATILRTFYFLP